MRYEDASGTFQASGPVANDDADTLSAGERGPATGNLITGEGTQYSSAGADSAAGGQITAIAGKGGEDSSFSGGKLSVAGEHGRLTVDADGNYSYLANGNVENVRDRFTYTLADNQGNSDTASLIVEIGKTPAVIKADAQQVVPGPDGVVTLPPGVELSDVHVVGRNLVVDLPDGSQLVIIDGAIFVPQLVLGGVEVPATNVAALLIGQEVQPAAGEIPPSSGGNFALPPPPLDPGIPLGDLIPPTELNYIPPEPQQVLETINEEPEIFVQPDGQPASVAAVDEVDEAGLPTRNDGEPQGSGEEAAAGTDGDPSEATAGTIIISSPDGVDSVTINDVLVTGVIGQQIDGVFGTLTITGFDGDNILYSYVLDDNTTGDDTQDDFEVVLTDDDGDTATATLTIDIVDDVPTARADTDAIAAGQFGPVTGNVITDASAGDAGDGDSGADTLGADDADLTAVTGFGSTTPFEGGFTVNGQYGVLTINVDGSYSYTRSAGTPGGVNDVFNYTLTDGDGDTTATTLTINIGDLQPLVPTQLGANIVAEAGLPERNGEPAGSGEIADGNGGNNSDTSETISGSAMIAGGDGPLTVTIDGVQLTSVGQTFVKPNGVLTITAINPGSIDYTFTLTDNTSGDSTNVTYAVVVTDQDGDTASGNFVVNIADDIPAANDDTDALAAGTFGPETGNVISGAGTTSGAAGADVVGADSATVSGLASVNVPGNVDNDAAGGLVVNGQYGTLTMQADGSYSYVRNAGTPGGVDDVFTYSLTDGDGDVDTATLTINIGDSPTTIDAPDQGEGGTAVDEQGLPTRNGGEPAGTGEVADGDGADNDDTSETTAGTITYTAPDGPATVTIDGVAVTSVGQTFAGSFGTLTITSIASGSIGYSYTLADNTSGDATADDFAISVTDVDGDVANDTLVINIIDDEPIAVNDTDSITTGGNTATGNVITDAAAGDAGDGDDGADTVGADNATISGLASNNVPANSDNNPAGGFVVVGAFGTLTMQADGSYSYLRNDGSPGNAQDVFTYTLTDSDGDSTTATLTISIEDAAPTLPDPAAVLLDDDALSGGNPNGTGDDVNSQGTPGQLVGSGGDGDLDYAFTGVNGLPAGFTVNPVNAGQIQILQGATVVLTITLDTETGAYTVVQNNPIDHPAGLNENNLSFTVGVQVVDADGDVEPASITINVDDDTPLAANDTDSIPTGSNGPATGNVITDAAAGDAGDSDTGADSVGADGGAAIVGLASNNVPANIDNDPAGGFVVAGAFGTLTMQADGSYSYLRTDGLGAGQNEVFTYTLTDADGDTTTATLTISIANATPTLPDPAAVLLDDDALTNGNPGGVDDDVDSQGTPGQLVGSGGDGDLDYAFTGVNGLPTGFTVNPVNAGQIQILQGATVVLTVTLNTETGAYTVVQNNPIDHPSLDELAGDDTENNLSFSIGVRVVDADGDSEPATITINVDDDTPEAIQPGAAALENEAGASTSADLDNDGEVITDFGADGPGLVQFANIADGDDSGLTSNDDPIEYWLSNDGQTLQARTNSTNGTDGQLIFTVQINQATGDYTVTMTGAIDNGSGISFDNLTSSKAGNVDVRGVGADDPDTMVDLLLTASGVGGVNATINTDADSLGSGNQSMDQGETVRIDFVTNLEDDPTDNLATLPSGFSYDGHVGTQSYLQTIPQVQGEQGQTVAFRVYALNTTVTDASSPDDTPANGFSDSDVIAITTVTVDGYNDGPDDGTPNEPAVTVALGAVGTWTTIAYGVSARLESDGSVTFTGIQQGDQYGFETGTDFNAVAVTSLPAGVGPAGGQSTTNSFDLGVFSIGRVDSGDPIDISFDLQITDADGDTVVMPDAIDITFNPATDDALAATSLSAQSFSKAAANDDYSSLLAGDTGQKSTGNAFANAGNTGITSAMVAASGLAAMSMTSVDSFSQPSDESLVQDSFVSFSTQVAGSEGADEGMTSISFGSQLDGSAVDAANLSSSSFSFGDQDFGSRGLEAMSSGGAEPAYTPSYASGEPTVASIPALAANVPTVSMVSAEMLKAASLEGDVQDAGAVEQVLADTLGSDAPTIDAVLANLPGGIAELAAIANLASPDGTGVPAWDMGMQGGFAPSHDMLMKVAAVAVHHDAVQPA